MSSLTEQPKQHKYIFPDFLGKVMSKVDLRTQYEASMMSTSFMMLGMIVTGVYLFIYLNFELWYKIFLSFNLLAGLVFMISNLVTTYQQYQSYMEARSFQEEIQKS